MLLSKKWNNEGSLPSGYAGYKLCYYEVMKVIKGIVHQPYEVKGNSIFYAFSYYFDRAVETGLIGEWAHAKSLSGTIISRDNYHLMHKVGIQITCCFFFCIDDIGGVLEVRDFKKRAKEGRSRFLKACTLWECSELHTVHVKIWRAFGPWKPQNPARPTRILTIMTTPLPKSIAKHKSDIAAAVGVRLDLEIRWVVM